jgi:phage shock protein PspC (stress-responsive transcriptional regulator)
MAKVLEEMGPVEGEDPAREQSPSGEVPRKRLYRIRDDAKIAGVCAGIGAYFDIDANFIRLLFVVAALFTSGFFVFVYIVLMFVVPSAHTNAEWAAAHGVPFNAQEVIDRAKREYRSVADDVSQGWRSAVRAQRRAWRDDMRAWRHSWRDHGGPPPQPAQPVGYVMRILSGLAAFVFSLFGAALLIAFLVTLFSLLNTGAVFGWTPPGDLPNWLAIAVLCIAYVAVASPVGFLRRSSYAAASGYRAYGHAAGGFVTFVAVAAGAVLAYHFIPEFREWVRAIPDILRAIALSFG